MNYQQWINCLAIIALGALTTSCSSSSDGESSTASSKGSISSVPKATGAVNGASAASFDILSKGVLSPQNKTLATSGLALKAWGKKSQWTAAKSRAMCETGLLLKDALGEAMNPDKIACYVGSIQAAGKFGSNVVDNGEYVYFKLKNLPGTTAGQEPRIKMKVVKSGGAISEFEMFSCFDGGGTTQSEYIKVQISGSTGTVTSKSLGSAGSESYGSSAITTGNLDDNYKWNSKKLEIERFFNAGANGSYSQKASVTQKSNTFTVDGYNTGSFGTGATREFFTNIFYTLVEGLNMETPKVISLGDGTSKYSMNWCVDSNSSGGCNGGDTPTYTQASVDSWNGDNLEDLGVASNGTYFNSVNSSTIRTTTPAVTVSFTTAESWDCNASNFFEADLTDFETAASALGKEIVKCESTFAFARDNDATDSYPCGNAR